MTDNRRIVINSSNIFDYIDMRRPKCLSEYIIQKTKKINSQNLDWLYSTFHSLNCYCGSSQYSINGYQENHFEDELLMPPVTLTCRKCGKTSHLYSQFEDGYLMALAYPLDVNTKLKNLESYFANIKNISISEDQEIIVGFGYKIPDEDDTDLERIIGNFPDYFSSIEIYGKKNSEIKRLLFYECSI